MYSNVVSTSAASVEAELSEDAELEPEPAKVSEGEDVVSLEEEQLSDEDDLNDYEKLKAKTEQMQGDRGRREVEGI